MQPLFPQNQAFAAPIIQVPISQTNPPNLVFNQTSPLVINPVKFDPESCKLSPVTVQCPICHSIITTEVETICSFKAVCLFLSIGCPFYIILQKCYKKDLCCQDAIHSCTNCGAQIAKYEAC